MKDESRNPLNKRSTSALAKKTLKVSYTLNGKAVPFRYLWKKLNARTNQEGENCHQDFGRKILNEVAASALAEVSVVVGSSNGVVVVQVVPAVKRLFVVLAGMKNGVARFGP